MDRAGGVSYFGAMIRLCLPVLAALALMLVSLTASAHALGGETAMASPAATQMHAATASVPPCENHGDLFCAFACAGVTHPLSPDRSSAPCAYAASVFFIASAPRRAARDPEQADRPPISA